VVVSTFILSHNLTILCGRQKALFKFCKADHSPQKKVLNMDLKKLYEEIEQFTQERDWDQFHSIKNLSMALNVESSELMEIYQWVAEKKSNELHQDPVMKVRIEDEIADIFIYLLRIVRKTNTNLETAVKNKMQKNREKYPVELSRGNAKKYDELE
jgi:dCTP diphosphatase